MIFFNSIKHWQLFLLLMIPSLMPRVAQDAPTLNPMFFMVAMFTLAIPVLWMQAVGLTSNERLKVELKRKSTFFRIAGLVPFAYVLILFINGFPKPLSVNGSLPMWVVPMHFFTMFCFLYMLWFSSKQLGTLKKGSETDFTDYAGLFFLMWIFPIGVWFVQPVVNKLLQGDISLKS